MCSNQEKNNHLRKSGYNKKEIGKKSYLSKYPFYREKTLFLHKKFKDGL